MYLMYCLQECSFGRQQSEGGSGHNPHTTILFVTLGEELRCCLAANFS